MLAYENDAWEAAESCGEHGLRFYPDDTTLLGYLGLTLNRTDPDARGLSLIRKALNLNPDLYGSFYRDYPNVMSRAQKSDEGISDLEAAAAFLAEHQPGGPALGSATVALAELLSATGRTTRLVTLIQRTVSDAPQLCQVLAPFLYRPGNLKGSRSTSDASGPWPRATAHLSRLSHLLSGSTPPLPGSIGTSGGGIDLDLAVTQEIDFINASSESGQRLLATGLSPSFVAVLKRGAAALARETRVRVAYRPWHDDPVLSDRVKDVLDTAASGKKAVLSPFSGRIGHSNHMVAIEAFFFAEAERHCVVLQWSNTDAPFADTAWFFPKERLFVFLAESNYDLRQMALKLRGLIERILGRSDEIREHLAAPCQALLVGEFECPHIGHYIWNCISGWSPFFRYGGGSQVDGYVVYKDVKLLGSVGELYSDEPSVADGRLTEISREAEGSDLILKDKALLLTVKDRHVSKDLAERVIRWSHDRCSEAFHRRLEQLRASADPLILITVRLDNRSWVEQAEGWVAIVSQLKLDFPRLGVVIDGGNSGVVQGWTHAFMSTDAERQIASRLVSSCGGPEVIYDSIGCSVAESIVLATHCDFFIAPVGAGMAKYRWIANLPGVAFSNTSFSQPSSFDGRLYDLFRDDAKPAQHVPPECIDDVEVRRGEVSRANFSMDWRALHREVLKFVERSGRSHRG